MKRFTFFVFMLTLLVTTLAWGQVPLLEENFLYAPGRLVNTLPYNVRATTGANKQTISWTHLSYAGYAGSGIGWSDSLTADGDDYSIDWANYVSTGVVLPATGVNSGSVYLAALVNVQTITSTPDYFIMMHYNNTFSARVYVQQSGLGFNFGASKGSTTGVISYESTTRTLGQTYLVVLKYTFNTGSSTDDRIDFWVNPTVGGSEPTPTIANFTDAGRNDIAMWTGVCLRQGSTTLRALAGGIRMGTDWATTAAPQYVWTGATDNNFQTSTNWSPNRTSPSVYDVLVFNTGGSITPTSLPTQSISGLVIDGNTTLTLSGTGLTVTGSLTLASGTISGSNNLTLGNGATITRADGTLGAAPTFGASTNLTYCGTSAQTTGSECPTTVNNLTIANTNGTTLSNNLAVNNLLKVGGIMSLNGKTVTLGTSTPAMGSVTFTNSYGGFAGTGTFKRWFPASAIVTGTGSGNNGQFPLTTNTLNNRTLLISGTPTVGGSVSVSYNDASSKSSISFTENTFNFINRFDANWGVTVGDGLTCSAITLAINGAGIPGINAIADLNISGAAGAAPGTFSATTGTAIAPVVNRTALSQVTLPSTYYFASTSTSPLPVELTSFAATAQRPSAFLHWSTATENNCAGFAVERATAGNTPVWKAVGFVDGAGTSNVPHSYTFADQVAAGKYLYRLKQIDRDGKFQHSAQVEVVMALTAEDYGLSKNYPNPFNPSTTIRFAVRTAQHVSVRVYNTLGREVATVFNGVADANRMYEQTFDASALSSGTYFCVFRSQEKNDIQKMLLVK